MTLFIGRYCLVDAGLPHTTELMTPYRGVRYHLKEYSANPPRNAKELFNLRHSSLRNTIERAFGVLKRRFPIIRSTQEPFYSRETQCEIFVACCILHNFLLDEDRDRNLEYEVQKELYHAEPEEEEEVTHREGSERGADNKAEELRNKITREMWKNYVLYRNHR